MLIYLFFFFHSVVCWSSFLVYTFSIVSVVSNTCLVSVWEWLMNMSTNKILRFFCSLLSYVLFSNLNVLIVLAPDERLHSLLWDEGRNVLLKALSLSFLCHYTWFLLGASDGDGCLTRASAIVVFTVEEVYALWAALLLQGSLDIKVSCYQKVMRRASWTGTS